MNALAIPQPTSLAQVEDTCESVEAWAEQCDDIPQLRDTANKLAAVDEYLARTSTDGRARVAATVRRIEVRIGQLSPERKQGERTDLNGTSDHDPRLDRQVRDFRQMAANPEVVDDVIDESDDDDPPSRRKVMRAIKHQAKPQRSPLASDAERAGWQFRKAVERLETITEDDRFSANKRQVADHLIGHLSYAIEVCTDLYNQLNEG